jgi:hypothetical protein
MIWVWRRGRLFEVAQFVETHQKFDWGPLWKALGTDEGVFLPPCDLNGSTSGDCSAELITVLKMKADPVERLEVAYNASFRVWNKNLAPRFDSAVYTRRGERFEFDEKLSKSSKADVEAIYDIHDGRSTNEDYLRYLLKDLRAIATGPEGEPKAWLRRFLPRCGNTAEKRELQMLLGQ